MAAPMEHAIRVKVDFSDLGTEPSWISVCQRQCPCISDVEKKIVANFCLGVGGIKLVLSGHRLPSWEETTGLLRENDTIHVISENKGSPESKILVKKKKRKKEESSISELSDSSQTKSERGILNDEQLEDRKLKKRKRELLEALDSFSQGQGHEQHCAFATSENSVEKESTQKNDLHQSGEATLDLSSNHSKKKRKRKKKKKGESPPLDKRENVLDLQRKFPDEAVIMNLPSWKQPTNKRMTFANEIETRKDKSVNDSSGKWTRYDGDSKEFKQAQRDRYSNKSQVFTNANSEATRNCDNVGDNFNSELAPCVQQSVLSNGVAVYTRMRKNKSNVTSSSKTEQGPSSTDSIMEIKRRDGPEQTTLATTLSKDYTQYSEIDGPPRQGDRIAFKTVELSSDYSPQISQFKEATVLSYDPITTMVELDLIQQDAGKRKEKLGKFDLPTADDEVDDDSETSSVVKMEWGSLLEIKLIT